MNSITDWIQAISSILSILVSIWLVFLGIRQLENLNQQLLSIEKTFKAGYALTILELESQISSKKKTLNEIAIEINRADLSDPKNKEYYNDKFDSAVEDYLNILDRLSFFIKEKFLIEKGWKGEYREIIEQAVNTHLNNSGKQLKFRHIMYVYNMWRNEDSM